MTLFHRELGGVGSPILILHGLLGTSTNCLQIGKLLAPKYKVYIIDQRNHGKSFHSNSFDYSCMAKDIKRFIDIHHIKNPIILGHSMGGKTAMQFAEYYPDSLQKLIIVDILPKQYPIEIYQFFLDCLNNLDLTKIHTRKQADIALSQEISNSLTRHFLLKNLQRNSKGMFYWVANLTVIRKNLLHIGDKVTLEKPIKKAVLLIKGSKSEYIKYSDIKKIKVFFPYLSFKAIENAGHWVHWEKPLETFKVIHSFLINEK